jgi:hypothetical protein
MIRMVVVDIVKLLGRAWIPGETNGWVPMIQDRCHGQCRAPGALTGSNPHSCHAERGPVNDRAAGVAPQRVTRT